MHGRHVLKIGFDANLVHDEMNNLYAANGSYNYDYRDNFFADLYQWQKQHRHRVSGLQQLHPGLRQSRLRLPYH